MNEKRFLQIKKSVEIELEKLWNNESIEIIEKIKQEGVKIVIAVDGQWAIRRNSPLCKLTVINCDNNKIIWTSTVQKCDKYGNDSFEGCPKAMEAHLFSEFLSYCHDNEIEKSLKEIVIDGDGTSYLQLSEHFEKYGSQYIIARDKAHMGKNYWKTKEFNNLGPKGQAHVKCWFWTSIKEVSALDFSKEQKETELGRRFALAIPHYTGECGGDCVCSHKKDQFTFSTENQKNNLSSLVKLWIEKKHLMFAEGNTSIVEAAHSLYAKTYGKGNINYRTFGAQVAATSMVFNNGRSDTVKKVANSFGIEVSSNVISVLNSTDKKRKRKRETVNEKYTEYEHKNTNFYPNSNKTI